MHVRDAREALRLKADRISAPTNCPRHCAAPVQDRRGPAAGAPARLPRPAASPGCPARLPRLAASVVRVLRGALVHWRLTNLFFRLVIISLAKPVATETGLPPFFPFFAGLSGASCIDEADTLPPLFIDDDGGGDGDGLFGKGGGLGGAEEGVRAALLRFFF